MQNTLCTGILRAFVGRTLLQNFEAKAKLAYPHSGFPVDTSACIEAHDRAALKRDAKADELRLTPPELIDRKAPLVPPPRPHRHRYCGVLAPNSALRAAVTALAQPATPRPATFEAAQSHSGGRRGDVAGQGGYTHTRTFSDSQTSSILPMGGADCQNQQSFPAVQPNLQGHIRIMTHSAEIRNILNRIQA